jgi:Domain of unknown function (DUF5615)
LVSEHGLSGAGLGEGGSQRFALKLAIDENLDNRILRGLRRFHPELDAIRIQDTEIYEADDPVVLEWCAVEERILVSHDFRTIPKYAYERIRDGQTVAGIILVPTDLPIQQSIEDLHILIECASDEDWTNRLEYLPL